MINISKKIWVVAFFLCATNMVSQAQTVTTKFKHYLFSPDMDLSLSDKTFVKDVKIGTIPGNKEVTVIGIDTIKYLFYKVQYKKKIGYIHKSLVKDNSYIISADPNIRDKYKEKVIGNYIAIGMNKYELEASVGLPEDINRTVTSGSISEQWCYGDLLSGAQYIYLKNGIVTSYQD